jgi:hypothetical protein
MLDATTEVIRNWFPDDSGGLIAEMNTHPDIFVTPEGHYQLREDFVSGNAWEKIDILQGFLDRRPDNPEPAGRLAYGLDELRKAVGWTPVEEAPLTPRDSWIPEHVVNAWVHDEDGLNDLDAYTLGKNGQGKWGIVPKEDRREYNGKTREWETTAAAGRWREHNHAVIYYLNHQKQRSKYNHTPAYNKELDDNFKNYIANHAEYRDTLETSYNRLYNSEIKAPVKTYPILLDGWSGAKTLKSHQWQSVHHLYRQEKGMSALGAGFGKTLTGIALFQVLRQEGKINRAFFQVPNNKVKDWAAEFRDVLPGIRIGQIHSDMPKYRNREERYKMLHELAVSPCDVLIFSKDAAGDIQLSPENDEQITNDVIAKYLREKQPQTARREEKTKEQVRQSLGNGKENKTIFFEDLGCDAIFVDEAHNYKNLFTSSLSRETGMNDGRQSAQAMSLFKKAAFIRQNNRGRNVFLFTATPLTNSPLEYFNMLNYIAPEELEKFNITTIDGFIHNFADIEEGMTYDWKSGQVINKKILKGFRNLKTLQDIFFKYTDYQTDPGPLTLKNPTPSSSPILFRKTKPKPPSSGNCPRNLNAIAKRTRTGGKTSFPGRTFSPFTPAYVPPPWISSFTTPPSTRAGKTPNWPHLRVTPGISTGIPKPGSLFFATVSFQATFPLICTTKSGPPLPAPDLSMPK